MSVQGNALLLKVNQCLRFGGDEGFPRGKKRLELTEMIGIHMDSQYSMWLYPLENSLTIAIQYQSIYIYTYNIICIYIYIYGWLTICEWCMIPMPTIPSTHSTNPSLWIIEALPARQNPQAFIHCKHSRWELDHRTHHPLYRLSLCIYIHIHTYIHTYTH